MNTIDLGCVEDLTKTAMKPLASSVKRSVEMMLAAHGLPRNSPYVVGAGAAMYFHGLRPGIRDIDLYVPNLPVPHDEKFYGGMEVDAKPTWGLWPGRELMRTSVVVDGVRVMRVPWNADHQDCGPIIAEIAHECRLQ